MVSKNDRIKAEIVIELDSIISVIRGLNQVIPKGDSEMNDFYMVISMTLEAVENKLKRCIDDALKSMN